MSVPAGEGEERRPDPELLALGRKLLDAVAYAIRKTTCGEQLLDDLFWEDDVVYDDERALAALAEVARAAGFDDFDPAHRGAR